MRPLLALLLPVLAFAQLDITQPKPEAHPVVVDVLVRTKTGAVTGLAKEDFVLKDKGKVQTISNFAATPARDPTDKPNMLAPGIGANRLNWRGELLRSGTVILFDRLNTPAADQAFGRRQVLTVLGSLKDGDAVAFVSLYRNFSLVHDFTSDPGPLIRAAKRILGGGAAATDPIEIETQKRLEDALVSTQEIDQSARPPLTAAAFRSISLHLAGIPGRKSLVWVTRSFPLTFGADVYRRNETANELAITTAILQESNVAVYPVSPGGAGTGFSDNSTRSDRPVEGALMPGANAAVQTTPGTLGDSSNMQLIADATGGHAYYNINDLVPAIRAVFDDNQLNYTLAFQPEAKSMDDRMHGLEVELVKGKAPGAEIRFRKKYLATQRNMRPGAPLQQLAIEPLTATAISIAGAAQPDPAKAGTQKVDVSVNPADLTMKKEGDKWTGGFDLGLFVEGAPVTSGTVKAFNLSLSDEQYKQVMTSGLVVNGNIPVKASGEVIRVVLRERSTGVAGSMFVTAR